MTIRKSIKHPALLKRTVVRRLHTLGAARFETPTYTQEHFEQQPRTEPVFIPFFLSHLGEGPTR